MNRFSLINIMVAILLVSLATNIQTEKTGDNSDAKLYKTGRSKDANEIFYEVKTNAKRTSLLWKTVNGNCCVYEGG